MSASRLNKVGCIWGANGLSGMGMVDVLIKQPEDVWTKIICVSRRPMQIDIKDDRISFISIDIMDSTVDSIVEQLMKVNGQTITHMFHYSYIQKYDENELDDANKILLEKSLKATEIVAKNTLQYVLLQTGYKYYGVHKGPQHMPPSPFVEGSNRHQGVNFYYTQEDLIKEYAQKNKWNYIITRPNLIIGVSKGSFLNFAVSLAIYAALQKEKGEPLIFPGSQASWNATIDHSSSLNNALFQLWTLSNNEINNEIFNIHDGDAVQFRSLWSTFEKYFGFEHYDQKFPEDKMRCQLNLYEYMNENRLLWNQIIQRHQLDEQSFDYAAWMLAHFVFNIPFDMKGDLTKARKYGWTTTVDTAQSYMNCFDRLKMMKIIPS